MVDWDHDIPFRIKDVASQNRLHREAAEILYGP